FSPDGKSLAATGADHAVRVWDLATGKQGHVFLDRELGEIDAVAYSPDGTMLAATWHGVTVWDAASGKELQRFDQRSAEPRGGDMVAFSPDSRALVLGDRGTIYLCDPRTGKVLRPLEPRQEKSRERFSALVFSADGKMLFSGSSAGKLHGWEVATGRQRC